MPRLHIWFFTSGALALAGYAAREYWLTPSLTVTRDMELFAEAEKDALLRIVQRLQQLRLMVPERNCQKIALFSAAQTLRGQVIAMPTKLQSAFDRLQLLADVDTLQHAGCGQLLRFRDTQLTKHEEWRCFLAWITYLVTFRLVFPLAEVLCRTAGGAPCCETTKICQLRHLVARSLVELLEVRVTFDCDREAESLLSAENDGTQGTLEKLGTVGSEVDESVRSRSVATGLDSDAGRRVFLVWTPRAWVEEVCFWGAQNNPWLRRCRAYDSSTTLKRTDVSPNCPSGLPLVLLGAGDDQVEDSSLAERAERRNRRERRQLEADAQEKNHSRALPAPATPDVPVDGKTSFGYPPAVSDEAVRDAIDAAACGARGDVMLATIPLASLGVEKLLYAGPGAAIPDVQKHYSPEERYLEVVRSQYGEQALTEKGLAKRTGPDESVVHSSTIVRHPLRLPTLSLEAMRNIYGGRSVTGATRTVAFRIGKPCQLDEFRQGWFENFQILAEAELGPDKDRNDPPLPQNVW